MEQSRGENGIQFREALSSPVESYRSVQFSERTDYDSILIRILLDYKRGRQHQAAKRYANLLADLSFDTEIPLIRQAGKLNETTASLLTFELLFMLKNNTILSEETLWKYVDSVSFFDPDDVIFHGAIHNLLLVFFQRNGDLPAAFELAKRALNAYQRGHSEYLQMFIHLHLAYLHVFSGQLTDAERALDDAEALLAASGNPACETAMIRITRYWVRAEAHGELPDLQELRPLGEQIIDGEFWPETFLVFAALQLRAALASGAPELMDLHSTNEFTLRSHGLPNLLPAMQLLREECLPGDRVPARRKPLQLHEHELVLILPRVKTWRMNAAHESGQAPKLKRIRAMQDLYLARTWRERGRFDLAIKHLIPAMEIIKGHGFGYLLKSEADFIATLARECRKRGRFVETARGWLNLLAEAGTSQGAPRKAGLMGLTPTELGVLQRLPASASNKALALELGVSEATVKFHLKNIYRKLGVHKRRAAIDAARAKGII